MLGTQISLIRQLLATFYRIVMLLGTQSALPLY